VAIAHVLDVADPVVGQADARAFEGGQHAAAAVVADDHDVLHLEHLDGELDGRQRVEVGVHDDVGDVAVHEHLARLQAGDLVGGHAAVGAAYPHELGRLLLREAGEEAGALVRSICAAQARLWAKRSLERGGHGRIFT
jgi:hypothetical protein